MAEELVNGIDAEQIKQRVVKKAQAMLEEDKISEAQELLSFSKSIPAQLEKAAKDGLRLRQEKKYDKSSRSFEEASNFASMLGEDDLAGGLKKEGERSTEIPIFQKKKEKAIESARDALRKEDFLGSARMYKEAAEWSLRLGDAKDQEVNMKKHDILSQFAEMDSA